MSISSGGSSVPNFTQGNVSSTDSPAKAREHLRHVSSATININGREVKVRVYSKSALPENVARKILKEKIDQINDLVKGGALGVGKENKLYFDFKTTSNLKNADLRNIKVKDSQYAKIIGKNPEEATFDHFAAKWHASNAERNPQLAKTIQRIKDGYSIEKGFTFKGEPLVSSRLPRMTREAPSLRSESPPSEPTLEHEVDDLFGQAKASPSGVSRQESKNPPQMEKINLHGSESVEKLQLAPDETPRTESQVLLDDVISKMKYTQAPRKGNLSAKEKEFNESKEKEAAAELKKQGVLNPSLILDGSIGLNVGGKVITNNVLFDSVMHNFNSELRTLGKLLSLPPSRENSAELAEVIQQLKTKVEFSREFLINRAELRDLQDPNLREIFSKIVEQGSSLPDVPVELQGIKVAVDQLQKDLISQSKKLEESPKASELDDLKAGEEALTSLMDKVKKGSFSQKDITDLAEGLRDNTLNTVRDISSHELARAGKPGGEKAQGLIDIYDNLNNWVTKETLTTTNPKQLLNTVKFMLSLAEECKANGDFNSVMAINSGLQHPYLTQPLAGIAKKDTNIQRGLESLTKLCDYANNFRNIRAATAQFDATHPTKPPISSYFLYFKDQTGVNENNPAILDGALNLEGITLRANLKKGHENLRTAAKQTVQVASDKGKVPLAYPASQTAHAIHNQKTQPDSFAILREKYWPKKQ